MLRIPTPDVLFISQKNDIFEPNLPLRVLHVIEKYKFVATNMEDNLQSKLYGWKCLLLQKKGMFPNIVFLDNTLPNIEAS